MMTQELELLERFVKAHERQARALGMIAGILLREEQHDQPAEVKPNRLRTMDDEPEHAEPAA